MLPCMFLIAVRNGPEYQPQPAKAGFVFFEARFQPPDRKLGSPVNSPWR
ncbi:hypothetical protein FHS01_004630 [Longimicrobium terrae]|uniref:Uncharacterized protein n=1 Tax=Longimicrobium terrae TaxID=1639882 RepID=A0A841H494_9BACT|nr:hypothetical protein [Longimicrobium terrae]MBB6072793.1 hypothetical protein [Longimicrobium terrae]